MAKVVLDGLPKSALNLSYNAYNSHLAIIGEVCGLFSSTCYKFSRQRLQMSHVCASVTLFAQCCFKQIWPQVLFNSKLEVYKSWGETAGHLHIFTSPDLANLAFPNCSFMFQCLHFSLRLIVAQSHHSCSCSLFNEQCSLNTILGTIEKEVSGPHF